VYFPISEIANEPVTPKETKSASQNGLLEKSIAVLPL
jgi:hypothetical protein